MKKLFKKILNFFKGLWLIIKSMGNWRGILSLAIVWISISGVGIAVIGFIINNNWLKGIGATIFAFWAGPFTPLIPLTIALAMLMQRYIFRDKSVSFTSIKEKFKEAFKNKDVDQTNKKNKEDLKND